MKKLLGCRYSGCKLLAKNSLDARNYRIFLFFYKIQTVVMMIIPIALA